MKKRWFAALLALAMLSFAPVTAFAEQTPDLAVQIVTPTEVKALPGQDTNVEAVVTNQTDHPVADVMAYITMANVTKHWTVNLEDFSADKPVQIGTLQPKQSKTVTLPIRFVYTDRYQLYVTAVTDQQPSIFPSNAISVEILGNTMIDPLLVQIVSIAEPVLLLVCLALVIIRRRKRERV